MDIYLNKEKTQTESKSLGALLRERGLTERKGFAVAVNEKVVSRSKWDEQPIAENDRVMIISPTQGG
jgi:sulfur carrier protein